MANQMRIKLIYRKPLSVDEGIPPDLISARELAKLLGSLAPANAVYYLHLRLEYGKYFGYWLSIIWYTSRRSIRQYNRFPGDLTFRGISRMQSCYSQVSKPEQRRVNRVPSGSEPSKSPTCSGCWRRYSYRTNNCDWADRAIQIGR